MPNPFSILTSRLPLSRFRFDVHGPATNGAHHAIDLPYVFGSYKLWGRLVPHDMSANHELSIRVIRAWTNFARCGDPNGDGTDEGHKEAKSEREPEAEKGPHLPHWPRVSRGAAGPEVMVLDQPWSSSRVQHIPMAQALPTTYQVMETCGKACWFHRPAATDGQGVRANL
jgi:carboxylesterase type B